MKRTLYPKLLAGYLMYGLIGFLIITTFTYHITFAFVEKKEAASLYRESALISSNYAGNYFSKTMTLDEIQTQLSTLSTYLSSEIWIVDTHGNIILNTAAPGCDPTPVPGFNITDFGSRYYQTGTFYNQFTSEMLSVFSPITVNYKVRGYVVIHKPTSSLVSYANGLVAIAYETLGLLFLAAFVVLILFTYVVYIPIRKITKAADEYAAGNFEKKIDVHSNDEIGYLAASLNYMANELNTLEDDQKKFVSNVSHDFRSPLTSIKGYVEAMLDGTIPVEMQDKYLNIILFETERLNKLTKSLLELNKFGSHGTMLDITDFDINHTIRMTVQTFEGRCMEKRITFNLILTGEKLFVSADMSKIEQVLYNLIDQCNQIQPHGLRNHNRDHREERQDLRLRQGHWHRHPGRQHQKDLGALLQDGSLPRQGQKRNRAWSLHRKGDCPGTRRKHQLYQHGRRGNGIYLYPAVSKEAVPSGGQLTLGR